MDSKFLPLWNKSDTAITYSEEQGGGHMVELEVFHQIHCLVKQPLIHQWHRI